jgi:hypothetical protein
MGLRRELWNSLYVCELKYFVHNLRIFSYMLPTLKCNLLIESADPFAKCTPTVCIIQGVFNRYC